VARAEHDFRRARVDEPHDRNLTLAEERRVRPGKGAGPAAIEERPTLVVAQPRDPAAYAGSVDANTVTEGKRQRLEPGHLRTGGTPGRRQGAGDECGGDGYDSQASAHDTSPSVEEKIRREVGNRGAAGRLGECPKLATSPDPKSVLPGTRLMRPT
jgi:hypothetical protein